VLVICGYARCSTDGQSLDGQLAALRAAGCERVFAEKISGTRSDRPQLQRFIDALDPESMGVVISLDRLARSTRDLLNILATISVKGATFKSLNDPWADTSTPHGQLMVTVLAGLSEFERHLILRRTSEGRKLALQNGVKFGRKPKLTDHQRREALVRLDNGDTVTNVARTFNVSHSTICRLR
jgi:DNA invertase Pin-like site-specific DNA recombinase